jgi:hypothetical protein
MSEDAYDSVGAVAVTPGTHSCRKCRGHEPRDAVLPLATAENRVDAARSSAEATWGFTRDPSWGIDPPGARVVFTTLDHPFYELAG